MIKPPDVPDLDDQADRGDKGDPAQRLQRLHHRRPPPVGDDVSQLLGDPRHAPFRFVDRVAILLQRNVLRRTGKTEIGEPAPVGQRSALASGIAAALPA